MLSIGRVGIFLPLLVIVRCHIGDTTFGRNFIYIFTYLQEILYRL